MNYNKNRIQNRKLEGQSLLEVVLSIGIASLVISALIILGASSVKTINSSLRRNEASKLANEGVEAMRFYRDEEGVGYSSLINDSAGDTYACYDILATSISAIECNVPLGDPKPEDGWISIPLSDTNFERQIFVQYFDPDDAGPEPQMIRLVSTVRWPESDTGPDGDNYKDVVMTTVFTDWGD